MAGRGRSATLPAWMTSGGIAETELKAEGQETTIVNLPSIETSTIPTTQNIISNTNIIAPSYSIPSSYNSSTTNPYPTSASTIVIPPHPSFLQPPNSFAINVPKPFQTPIYPGLGHGLQAPTTLGMPGNTPFAYNVPSWNPATQYGLQQLPTQMPTFVPPPRAYPTNPMQPRPISAGPPQLAMDPNNDVKAWSEHSGTDGRVYWFNKLTAVSTYEKPFCLKTPEERAIPPCPWKEYATPEGKKYYSNGTESV